jgi:formyl-CoA transferase
VFGATDVTTLAETLAAADIAFARVSDMAVLATHPHLRRITVATPSGPVSCPAPPRRRTEGYGAVPALGEHSEKLRAEFAEKKG